MRNEIYGQVERDILVIELEIIEEFAVYKAEVDRINELSKSLKDVANDFLDEQNVTNTAIRSAYVDWFRDKMEDKINDRTNYIKNKYRKKILTKELYMWASFNGKTSDANYYYNILNSKNISKSCIKVWLQKQKDKNIDFEEYLEDIKEKNET